MAKLDKLIELNSLEKQNRRNRLEDKLRQQQYYGGIEELFDPVTKTLNTNSEALLAISEAMQALQNKTLTALEDNNNVSKALNSQKQSSFLDRASLLSPTLDPSVKLKDDRGKTFIVDNDMIDLHLLMGKETNKQLELKLVDPNSNKFKINGVDVSLVPDGINIKSRVYDFLGVSLWFFINKDVTQKDIRGEENIIRLFLGDINYNRKRYIKK